MNSKKKETRGTKATRGTKVTKATRGTKVLCPGCGTEFAIAKNEFTTVATVIGEDSGLGVIFPAVVEKKTAPAKLPEKADERIEALRNAGVDVSCLFAMRGANGGECIASNKGGKLVVLNDNDPLFDIIISQGTVPNGHLFRRWVMSKMFHMMSETAYRSKEPLGVTEMIHRLGYEYQWKMLMNELYAQMKMESKDPESFIERNRWFNTNVVEAMARDYTIQLKERVDALKVRNCKGIPYKRICSRNIFVSDLAIKLYYPLDMAMARIRQAKNAAQLYNAARIFNNLRIKMAFDTPQSKAWIDAYKGSGAYFTMQNLIRFHGCVAYDDGENRLDKTQSLDFLRIKAMMYANGEGLRLLAVLKKILADNNIDIKKKMAEWRKKK